MTRRMILAAAVFAGLMLCAGGCRWDGEQTQEDVAPEPEAIVLHWMLFGESYQDSEQVFQAFNQELKQFFPDTTVEFEVISRRKYKEKWDQKMAANETVDLAWLGNDTINFTEEVKKGSLTALDYLLKRYGSVLRGEVSGDLWPLVQMEGNTYAIPIPGAQYRANLMLAADESLMRRYGDIDTIGAVNRQFQYSTRESYQAFEPFLATIMEKEDVGTGISCQSFARLADKGYEGIYGTDSPFVIKIFDDKPIVYNKYELDSYTAFYSAMSKWYQAGYIRRDVADVLDPLADDGRKGGSILFIDEYGDKKTAPDLRVPDYTAVWADLEGYRYINYAGCKNSLVIPKSAEYPQRAMELVNLLYSEEGKALYRLLTNGIEGTHYVRVDDSVIARMSDSVSGYRYTLSPYTAGNVFQNFELEAGQFELLNEYNKTAVRSVLTGFELDTRMIAIEMARVDLVAAAYRDKLSQGIAEDWESLYQEFLQKMNEAGAEKVRQEMQRQIDEFLQQEKIR